MPQIAHNLDEFAFLCISVPFASVHVEDGNVVFVSNLDGAKEHVKSAGRFVRNLLNPSKSTNLVEEDNYEVTRQLLAWRSQEAPTSHWQKFGGGIANTHSSIFHQPFGEAASRNLAIEENPHASMVDRLQLLRDFEKRAFLADIGFSAGDTVQTLMTSLENTHLATFKPFDIRRVAERDNFIAKTKESVFATFIPDNFFNYAFNEVVYQDQKKRMIQQEVQKTLFEDMVVTDHVRFKEDDGQSFEFVNVDMPTALNAIKTDPKAAFDEIEFLATRLYTLENQFYELLGQLDVNGTLDEEGDDSHQGNKHLAEFKRQVEDMDAIHIALKERRKNALEKRATRNIATRIDDVFKQSTVSSRVVQNARATLWNAFGEGLSPEDRATAGGLLDD